jgi:hypothetical protein
VPHPGAAGWVGASVRVRPAASGARTQEQEQEGRTMKKVAIILAMLAVVLMVAQVGMAADKGKDRPKRKRPDGIRGKVVKVDGSNLTITPYVRGRKKDDPKPDDVTVDASEAEVIIDRKPGKLEDLAAGNFVFITPKEGKAKKIHAFTKRPSRGGKRKPHGDGGKKKPHGGGEK